MPDEQHINKQSIEHTKSCDVCKSAKDHTEACDIGKDLYRRALIESGDTEHPLVKSS